MMEVFNLRPATGVGPHKSTDGTNVTTRLLCRFYANFYRWLCGEQQRGRHKCCPWPRSSNFPWDTAPVTVHTSVLTVWWTPSELVVPKFQMDNVPIVRTELSNVHEL